VLVAVIGAAIIVLILLDGFEATVLPRRVTRRWRPTRLFFRTAWGCWRRAVTVLPRSRFRENSLAVFGPLSLLGLFTVWIVLLITGFACIHWGLGTLEGESDPRQYLYMSGETFFTLGYGDVTSNRYDGKFLSVLESGIGFGFMAIIIGYLPVLYQAFSRREQSISLLDARAGSPPTAAEFIRRLGPDCDADEIDRALLEWELWSADLLESHLSFPVLGYYRSQHDNQSWLATLAVILDVSAFLIVTGAPAHRRRAERTFAMARHASVDLCLIIWAPPVEQTVNRLPDDQARELFALRAPDEPIADPYARLTQLRELYEPFLISLASYFQFRLPAYFPDRAVADNWQTSPWMKRAPRIGELPQAPTDEESHFG
jgi:hypothetical protein